METVEVHSKNYLVRWLQAEANTEVQWRVSPDKRSINFGVYVHDEERAAGLRLASSTGSVKEKLEQSGFRQLLPDGLIRIEGKETNSGSAKIDRPIMLAFVFDNTFSISQSKHVHFSFSSIRLDTADSIANEPEVIVETTSPPTLTDPVAETFPEIRKTVSASSTTTAATASLSVHPTAPGRRNTSLSTTGESEVKLSADGRFATGYLQKKRRKNFQGFARRYFCLDKQKGLLNYYLNSRSSSLRGVMPVKIVDLNADRRNLQLTLNSGMERWTLKAHDASCFDSWFDQIEQLRSTNHPDESDPELAELQSKSTLSRSNSIAESGYAASTSSKPSTGSLPEPPQDIIKYLPSLGKAHHLLQQRHITSSELNAVYLQLLKESKSAFASFDPKNLVPADCAHDFSLTTVDYLRQQLTSNNFSLLSGISLISSIVFGFKATVLFVCITSFAIVGRLVSFVPPEQMTKAYIREFQNDINDAQMAVQEVVKELEQTATEKEDDDESEFDVSDSDDEDSTPNQVVVAPKLGSALAPLPHSPVHRRENVPSPSEAPPNLISMLKKAKQNGNMGAPITANEPMSGVQTIAEFFENSDLLDQASAAAPKSTDRIMLVAAFTVARLSSARIKERSMRKPFTPLLGESYECVREDRGFRFVSEKVMHKPEVIASQAESKNWTVHFTSRPHTKMWAKSAQLTDVGTFCVVFSDGEKISFISPEMFIRNLIAGERYVEPTGTVTVESSMGTQATVEYKSGGMFSGRSEEVTVTSGKVVYEGKWTESLKNGNQTVWRAKPTVNDAHHHYGWTEFCAQLNETTDIEQGQLPPNDSRLRPDLLLYEKQTDNEKAEQIKLDLEQHQRERRAELEQQNRQHEPFFFKKTKDANGHYVLRQGERNYWELRQKGNWSAIPNYFA